MFNSLIIALNYIFELFINEWTVFEGSCSGGGAAIILINYSPVDNIFLAPSEKVCRLKERFNRRWGAPRRRSIITLFAQWRLIKVKIMYIIL